MAANVVLLEIFVAALLVVGLAEAWGTAGHQVVAGIGEARLTNKARQRINTILNGQSLPEIAMWADNVKRQTQYAWSSPLHFVDIDDRVCEYDYANDCFDTKTFEKGICVTAAILNFTQQAFLSIPRNVNTTITDPFFLHAIPEDEAVKFLVHFLGDVHQPLHVGFRSDLGGNSIKVNFLGSQTNLHSVWDTNIITQLLNKDYDSSQDAWQQDLLARVSRGGEWYSQALNWEKCNTGALSCTAVYAQESAEAACKNSYQCVPSGSEPCPRQMVNNNAVLNDAYFEQASPVVSLRVAQGGVRLAALLNYLYG